MHLPPPPPKQLYSAKVSKSATICRISSSLKKNKTLNADNSQRNTWRSCTKFFCYGVPKVVPHGWNAVGDAACKKHPPPAIDDGSNVIGYKTHRLVAPRTTRTYSVC
nr:uncharacterized protein LOC115257047 [Aedes albopictus]